MSLGEDFDLLYERRLRETDPIRKLNRYIEGGPGSGPREHGGKKWGQKSKKDKLNFIEDLYKVGPKKPVGYLPISTLQDVGYSPEELKRLAEENGLKTFQAPPSFINSGALFVYFQPAVEKFISGNRKELRKNGLSENPEKFIKQIATKNYSKAYELLDKVFGVNIDRSHMKSKESFHESGSISQLNQSIQTPGPNGNAKTYCMDFDGVLHYHETGSGAGPLAKPLDPGIAMAKRIKAAGHKLVILTARPKEQHDEILGWLKGNGVKADEVTSIKPPAEAYIDDRAVPWPRNQRESKREAIKHFGEAGVKGMKWGVHAPKEVAEKVVSNHEQKLGRDITSRGRMLAFLHDKAEAVYNGNKSFRNSVNKPSGKQALEDFMKHWM